ncbi:hypothetical protein NQD34_013915 [Periophthalmus magnuspinnatus]|nr:hypothetical protein NQD34_013915 [Periophthalmus magnuspinnatus]
MDTDLSAAAQNGVHGSSTNPFTSSSFTSSPFTSSSFTSSSAENAVRPVENSPQTWTDSSNVASVFDPPPELQSSLMFLRSSGQNQTDPLPQNDLFLNFSAKPAPDISQKSKLSPELLDVTLDSPDLFRTTQTSALLNGNKSEMEDLFAAARSKEVNESFDGADSLFQPKSSAKAFYTEHSSNNNEKGNQSPAFVQTNDLFTANSNDKLDLFSPFSSSSSVDPFPSDVTRDIDFSKFDDPFADSPLKLSDPFQDASLDASDVFSPVSPKTNGIVDAFKVAPSRPKPPRPAPPRPAPPRPAPPVRSPKATAPSSDKPKEIVLTTPKGSQHSILQPTPLIQANSQCTSPNQSPTLTHVPTFRRPPKPLPRIRRARTSVTSVGSDTTASSKPTSSDKPPKPQRPSPPAPPAQDTLRDVSEPAETVPSSDLGPDLGPDLSPKPPPKPAGPKLSPKFPFKAPQLQAPVVRRKHKKSDQVDPENYVVFENILLIGQEQCVEDWPEDSPEVQPDFRPRGTFRLRRESLMARTDSENDDPEADGGSKKKEKRFSFSIPSRRDSKGWSSDECSSRSRSQMSSRKSSREDFSDTGRYSSQEIKKDTDDPDQWAEHKKPHFKDKVSSLLRRASAVASLSDHKRTNGNVPHEAKDPEFKTSLRDSVRRHSEGTTLDQHSGESGDEFQSKKSKLKNLKLLRNKAFSFSKSSEEEPKGAHGPTPRKHTQDDLFGHDDFATGEKIDGIFFFYESKTRHEKSKSRLRNFGVK